MGIDIDRILHNTDITNINMYDNRAGYPGADYKEFGVHFVGFVSSDDSVSPIERFARQVPDGARWVVEFEDSIGMAVYNPAGPKVTALYSAHGKALIPKEEK